MKFVRERPLPELPGTTPDLPIVAGLPATDIRTVAVLGRAVRQKMDAAMGDLKSLVHVESLGEALHQVREIPTSVLLVSPGILKPADTGLLVKALSTTTHAVAVLDDESEDPSVLLRLGACGLKEAIDLRTCEGWHSLRQVLVDGADPVAGHIAAIALHHLEGAAPGTRRFFARMVYEARCIRTVCALADRFGIVPSTLMSRFHRARLPSPKTILSSTRLVFAKALLEEPRVSIAAVANGLSYSSPQAFGRQVWRMLRMSAGEFRRNVSFAQVAELYVEQLIVRHRTKYRTFDPFASFGGAHGTAPEEAHCSHLYH